LVDLCAGTGASECLTAGGLLLINGGDVKLPNFLIIGAAKSGTTPLHAYMKQHPQVFMSTPKEPTFFGHEGDNGLYNGPHDEDRAYHSRVVTTVADYAELFKPVTTQKAIGESSVYYLHLPQAPAQIKKYLPGVTMFALLRNPVDRAYSAYLHVVRQARERGSFARALQEEPERIRMKWNLLWHFKSLGFYYDAVKRYYDTFGRQQVHVYLYEDFQKEPLPFIHRICEILRIDTAFVPNMSKRYKVAYVPKSPTLEKVLYTMRVRLQVAQTRLPKKVAWKMKPAIDGFDQWARRNHVPPPPMPADVRASLLNDYREDILKLQDLLERDLSHWLSSTAAAVAAGI
jgi:hypothetical protein